MLTNDMTLLFFSALANFKSMAEDVNYSMDLQQDPMKETLYEHALSFPTSSFHDPISLLLLNGSHTGLYKIFGQICKSLKGTP